MTIFSLSFPIFNNYLYTHTHNLDFITKYLFNNYNNNNINNNVYIIIIIINFIKYFL